jgi:predicted AlkP superfamily pyrophosphatase or phosphodiesterase
MDENTGRMASYIFKKYKPNFMALHFACLDGKEHEKGRDGDSVRLALQCNDRAIGDIMEAVKQSGLQNSTAIIIVGDHGFCTINQLMRPNMLIKDISAKFIAAGGSAFLYTKPGTTETNENIITAVKKELNALPKDKRKLFRYVEKTELDIMGADSSAIFAITAVPGLVFSGAITKAAVTNNGPGTLIQQNPLEGVFIPTTGGHHGYDPNIPDMWTGFIAAGAGINKGGKIKQLCVTDIAPLIATLLNINFTCPDGKLPEGVIQEQ